MKKKPSSGFAGFQKESGRITPLPNAFFSELLPQIDHLGELKITLYAFWVLARQDAKFPFLLRSDVLSDERFLGSLPLNGMTEEEALDDALERALQRGTLLMAQPDDTGNEERYYFLNAPKGRRGLKELSAGTWVPKTDSERLTLSAGRPNIFVLYEQNIGALTPILAERLQEAEEEYPASWIKSAIEIAVANNVRKWRYIEAILEDWNTKGRDDQEDRRDLEETRQRYLGGEFAEYIKH